MAAKLRIKHPENLIASMRLNGSQVDVGWGDGEGDLYIILDTDENMEPVYMSCQDARLLVSALQAALAGAEE